MELLSADAVKVRVGASATVEAWGGPPIAAQVVRVEPSGFTKVSALGIEEQRVRTILELRGSAEALSRLGHDYRVFVRITVYKAGDALRVPISALSRKGERWAAFVVERRTRTGHGRSTSAIAIPTSPKWHADCRREPRSCCIQAIVLPTA